MFKREVARTVTLFAPLVNKVVELAASALRREHQGNIENKGIRRRDRRFEPDQVHQFLLQPIS